MTRDVPPRGRFDVPLVGVIKALLSEQRTLFLLVGGANTAFSTALYALLIVAFGPAVPAVVSLAISWVVSLVIVFLVYRRYVFKVKGHFSRDLARFASVNVLSLVINMLLLAGATELAGFPPVGSQIVITIIIVVFNYVGHRYFSFRR